MFYDLAHLQELWQHVFRREDDNFYYYGKAFFYLVRMARNHDEDPESLIGEMWLLVQELEAKGRVIDCKQTVFEAARRARWFRTHNRARPGVGLAKKKAARNWSETFNGSPEPQAPRPRFPTSRSWVMRKSLPVDPAYAVEMKHDYNVALNYATPRQRDILVDYSQKGPRQAAVGKPTRFPANEASSALQRVRKKWAKA